MLRDRIYLIQCNNVIFPCTAKNLFHAVQKVARSKRVQDWRDQGIKVKIKYINENDFCLSDCTIHKPKNLKFLYNLAIDILIKMWYNSIVR